MFEVPEWMRGQPPAPSPEQEHYFEVEITPKQKFALLALVRARMKEASKAQSAFWRGLETTLVSSRRFDGRLLDAHLDWADLEAEAERQGVSAADVLWDRMGDKSV